MGHNSVQYVDGDMVNIFCSSVMMHYFVVNLAEIYQRRSEVLSGVKFYSEIYKGA